MWTPVTTLPLGARAVACSCLNKMKECKAYGSIESAKGDCRTLSNDASDKYSIAILFEVPQWTSGSWKPCTCLIKIIRTMVQNEINEKYKRYWHSFEIPIGVCLHEYRDLLFVPIGAVVNLEKILISLASHCIDIPRTPVEECRHLSVKICMRGRKEKIACVQGTIRLSLVTYIPTVHKR